MTCRSGCPPPWKPNSWGRFWLSRQGIYVGVSNLRRCQAPASQTTSASQMSQLGYRGGPWEGEAEEILVALLWSPVWVTVQFHCCISSSTADGAGSVSPGSDRNCCRLSSSCSQGVPWSGRNRDSWCLQITHKETFNTWFFFYESLSTMYSIIITSLVYYVFFQSLSQSIH